MDQKPMLIGYAPHHEEVIEDVAGPSEYSECPRYYDNVVVSEDSESLRLHPILLQGRHIQCVQWAHFWARAGPLDTLGTSKLY